MTSFELVTPQELDQKLIELKTQLANQQLALGLLSTQLADQTSEFNASIENLKSRINELENLHKNPPTPDPNPLPDPVGWSYTKEGIREQFKYPPSKITDLNLREWNPPLISGDAIFTEDSIQNTVVAKALSKNTISEVHQAFNLLKSSNTDIRRWYDNNVHGRSKWPHETVLHLKLATLGDLVSIQWLNSMLADDEYKYSPYKIHNSLCAMAPFTGGFQQAGKHYDEGYGKSYEGMFTGAPFFLFYCWYWMTGEDLISSIPTFRHLGQTLKHRHKSYHGFDEPKITTRGGFTAFNCIDYADPTNKSGLDEWPRLPFGPFPTDPIPTDQWWWNCGDGVLSYYEPATNTEIDVSYSLTDSARSVFYPRCYGATRNNKGLLWALGFKANCTPRSCSGLIMEDFVTESKLRESDEDLNNDTVNYFFDTAYRVSDRANDPITQSEFVNPAPNIEGDKVSISYPRLHNRKGSLAYEKPFNAITSFEYNGKLCVIDEVVYTNPHPLTLTFTLSSVPTLFAMPDAVTLSLDGCSILIEGSEIETVHTVTNQAPNRDKVKINELYNPYNLEAIKAQVFIEFKPKTQFNLKTTVVWE